MSFTLYVILLVILGIIIFIGLILGCIKARLKIKWFILPVLIISLITTIVTDLSLGGSKLFIIQGDLTLKTSIIFSNQNYQLNNSQKTALICNGNSYIINNSKKDYYIEDIMYGIKIYDKIDDPYVESFSSSEVTFRILSYFGKDDKPIESINVKRGTSGSVKYWLRRASKEETRVFSN